MDGASHKLLAGSSFTCDENRRIAWRDHGDAREYTFQSRRGSNDLFKHRSLVDLFPQSGIFLAKLLLSPFAVLNVSTRNIPTHDFSLVVAHRVETNQKPAITSIRFARPQLHLVRRAG